MSIISSILMTDGYKFCHKDQYPKGIDWVYETWTPRKSRILGVNHVVCFGLQGALQELSTAFEQTFFSRPRAEVIAEIVETMEGVFELTNPEMVKNYDYGHFEALHDLGYLPIKIKAVEEGTFVPIGVPMFTIENTLPDFFWLPGFLETQLSSYVWQSMTSATIANLYKRILDKYAKITSDKETFFQAGDFSMRGMGSPEASYRVASGHLLSFGVSATIPARTYLMKCYQAERNVVAYAPSTEHSVMCSYGQDEKEAFLQLIQRVYPSGIVTVVSDSYDFWSVVDNVLPSIKDQIIRRKGKMNIRPDSGDPVKIICGDPESENLSIKKGLIERLYEIFGGVTNSKGFKTLDPHIGCIYGDSITPERAKEICEKLCQKGFDTTSVGLGIGSYTYQFVTRDTFGFALKGTAERKNGVFHPIFKDPKTDTDHFKKSHRGMVAVVKNGNSYRVIDNLTPDTVNHVKGNLLETVFLDGKLVKIYEFASLRLKVENESKKIYGGQKK